MNEDTPRFLNRLESGLRLAAAHLQELVDELAATLPCARAFDRLPDTADEWHADWQQHWDIFEAVLRRISELAKEASGGRARSAEDQRSQALAAAQALPTEAVKLSELWGTLQTQAGGLKEEAVRKQWGVLARLLESDAAALHAGAQAVRSKLELLVEHVTEQAYQKDLAKAAIDIEREQHRPGHVLEAMFMWVETDEERVRKERALEGRQAGA
ncbi:hypothetical protein [Prosthecobacter sp.]|uniref:hypothetical protein n=1 Tax=Prosthecobacter sp. TaxID=1965333 RepID=UPI002ABC3AF2|nr:hypothetical protein [Prosthecobacter sp.]MDZ4401756.1 hypothetical protein [Prosthecobacter sp.]